MLALALEDWLIEAEPDPEGDKLADTDPDWLMDKLTLGDSLTEAEPDADGEMLADIDPD